MKNIRSGNMIMVVRVVMATEPVLASVHFVMEVIVDWIELVVISFRYITRIGLRWMHKLS